MNTQIFPVDFSGSWVFTPTYGNSADLQAHSTDMGVAMPQPTTRDLMKPEELAAEWQVSPKTLANLRSRHEGPPFVRVLGCIRYSRQAVDEWLAKRQGDAA